MYRTLVCLLALTCLFIICAVLTDLTVHLFDLWPHSGVVIRGAIVLTVLLGIPLTVAMWRTRFV